MELQQLFTWAVERNPDRLAIRVAGEAGLTYAELEDRVSKVAAGFRETGIEPEDRIVVFSQNQVAVVETLLAGIYTGTTMVPVNARAESDELDYYLDDADADALVFHSSLKKTVATALEGRDLDACFQIGDSPVGWSDAFDTLTNYGRLEDPAPVGDEDRAMIVYTSGTTGDPKGVPVTHESWVYRALVWILRDGIRGDDTVGLVLPFYHVIGITAVLASVQSGATVVLPSASDPESILEAIESEEISTMQAVPTLFQRMANSAEEGAFDTSSLRRIESAGGILTDTVFEACREHLCEEFRNFYGTTETMNISYARENVNSVGKAADFQEVRLVSTNSKDPTARVKQGDKGEVVVRMDAPEVFDGYLNKSKKTDEVVHHGWYFTGDIGHRDEQGRLWLEGRVDDLIISGGENIAPSEVEDALLGHPSVVEAGVVGKPDEE